MKFMFYTTLVMSFVATINAADLGGWYSYSDDPGFTNNLAGKCTQDKSPGEYMKHYDTLGVPYKKLDEKKDGSGKITSLVIVKRPGGNSEERQVYFKDKALCEASYKLAADQEKEKFKKSKAKEDEKYGDYK